MKFGGTSVADAPRLRGVVQIVARLQQRRPIVVVSALAGVTDLLERAVAEAQGGDLERLEPVLADLERRHRWALGGCVEQAQRRHQLSLEIDGLFDLLKQRLRSIRILGEGTDRAADSVLALGEGLSSRILAAAMVDQGLRARWVDAGRVILTDRRFGSAEPDLESVRRQAEEELLPLLEDGVIPVLGGYVGSTADGEATTLGRGGSDTSAAVLGSATDAEEIQIWTDVDGMMSADPRLVPAARTLPRVGFAEAAELALYGARVLHPHSIAPAVQRNIPVRVLNSLRPESAGTLIVEHLPTHEEQGPGASVASRDGLTCLRIAARKLRAEPDFATFAFEGIRRCGHLVELAVIGPIALHAVVRSPVDERALHDLLASRAAVEILEQRALISVVGAELGRRPSLRASVLSALAEWQPDAVALGASESSVAAVVAQERLAEAVRGLHRRFVEQGGAN